MRKSDVEQRLLVYCLEINNSLVNHGIDNRDALVKVMTSNTYFCSHICLYVGQVGELLKNSKSFQTKYPDFNWKPIYRTRNILFHDYESKSLPVIASIVFTDIRNLMHLLAS